MGTGDSVMAGAGGAGAGGAGASSPQPARPISTKVVSEARAKEWLIGVAGWCDALIITRVRGVSLTGTRSTITLICRRNRQPGQFLRFAISCLAPMPLYTVIAADSRTGDDVRTEIEARDKFTAERIARERGLLVERVEFATLDY